ncbi:hypothetical protein RJ639_024715 [Escallonia herrerae]|uniref:RING-type domain-containing protein n=1 Tax=Escallonia herrerae TaxID=1293975 RepID=A0AA89ACB0_9ASTE|nr:hypothetical protein RJ639_024715 [Escallonia herrerae]
MPDICLGIPELLDIEAVHILDNRFSFVPSYSVSEEGSILKDCNEEEGQQEEVQRQIQLQLRQLERRLQEEGEVRVQAPGNPSPAAVAGAPEPEPRPQTKQPAELHITIFKSVCAICLEDISDGQRLGGLHGCTHMFHLQCVADWLKNTQSCPSCRTSA